MMKKTDKPLKLVSPAAGEIERPTFSGRPIELPGWRLEHRRARPIGQPTMAETQHALTLTEAFHDSAPYWKHDIVAYVSEHAAWGEKASQITLATGYAAQTGYTIASVMRKVDQPERDLAPTFEHAKLVAKLPKAEQRKWLKKASTEGWGKRELTIELQAAQRRGIIEGQADIEGMFRVWSIDCPWIYDQAQPSKVSAQSRYPGMTVDELITLGATIAAHSMKNAVAFFWITAPMLYFATDPEKGPDPYRVIRACGFEPKTGGVWDKVEHNFGHYLSIRHEHLIIATRGVGMTPDRPTPMIDSVFTERKSDVHSEKPECSYKMIERLYDGPYCEMFARERRKGWTTYGNQILEDIIEQPKKKARA